MEATSGKSPEIYVKAFKKRARQKKLFSVIACAVAVSTLSALTLPAISQSNMVYCGLEEHQHTELCYATELICTLGSAPAVGGETAQTAVEGTDAVGEKNQILPGTAGTDAGQPVSTEPDEEAASGGEPADTTAEEPSQLESTESAEEAANGGELADTTAEEPSQLESTELAEEAANGGEPADTTAEEPSQQESTESAEEAANDAEPAVTSTEGAVQLAPVESVERTDTGEAQLLSMTLLQYSGISEPRQTDGDQQAAEPADGRNPVNTEEHRHTEACYEKKLICGLGEHTHSLACRSDPGADTESPADWTAALSGVTLSGAAGEDLLAVAQMQIGYQESQDNFAVAADEITKLGYTRYGAWYGDPYSPWNTVFIAFCAEYAGADTIPKAATAADMITALQTETCNSYRPAAKAEPVAGDLIFFDTDGDGTADRVGIVEDYSIPTLTIQTIEGDVEGQVSRVTYDLTDPSVLGYARVLPEEEESRPEIYSLVKQTGTPMYHPPDYATYQLGAHRVNDMRTLTYLLVPKDAYDAGGWEPNMTEWDANADANYVVAYCADRTTMVTTEGGDYTAYPIRDSADYKDCAEVLTGVVEHAYPFITAEEMQAELTAAYQAGEIAIDLSCCMESDFIAAAQWAIWDMSGKSGIQTTATGAVFPDSLPVTLNPLTDVGHTEPDEIQSHVEAIRNWLVTQRAPADLAVAGHLSQIRQQTDGTYEISTVVDLNRPLEERESLIVEFAAGEAVSQSTVSGKGTEQFTLSLTGLTAQQVTEAKVVMNVHFEHMQVYIYDSTEHQDMISGRWGEDVYTLSFDVAAERTSVEVTKEWDDGVSGVESVQIQLYADGEARGDPVQLSDSNGWYYRWDDLLKYSTEETVIRYTVRETLVPGYLSTVSGGELGAGTDREPETVFGTADFSYRIKNTKTEEETTVSVSKEWAGRQDGIYPDSMVVNLLQNGAAYGNPVTLSAANDWSYCWERLPLKVGDMTYTYSVEEVPIGDYTATVQETQNPDGSVVFTLCNTWAPEFISLILSKVDADNLDQQLSGAEFCLYEAAAEDDEGAVLLPNSPNAWGVLTETVSVGAEGTVRIEALRVGRTYYLVETGAPAGYRLPTAPIVFTVEKDSDGIARLTILYGEIWVTADPENTGGDLHLQIRNEKEFVLPETGGIGTVRYHLTGLLFVISAIILFAYQQKFNRKGEHR